MKITTAILIFATIVFFITFQVIKYNPDQPNNHINMGICLIGSMLSYKLDKLLSRGNKE